LWFLFSKFTTSQSAIFFSLLFPVIKFKLPFLSIFSLKFELV
jgi:hypothetical protein